MRPLEQEFFPFRFGPSTPSASEPIKTVSASASTSTHQHQCGYGRHGPVSWSKIFQVSFEALLLIVCNSCVHETLWPLGQQSYLLNPCCSNLIDRRTPLCRIHFRPYTDASFLQIKHSVFSKPRSDVADKMCSCSEVLLRLTSFFAQTQSTVSCKTPRPNFQHRAAGVSNLRRPSFAAIVSLSLQH